MNMKISQPGLVLVISLLLASCSGSLNYVKTNLDEALVQAKKQHKYLLVIAQYAECSACEEFEKMLHGEKSQLQGLLADQFLILKYNGNVVGNEFLFYLNNSVGSPSMFTFSPEGKLLNVVTGGKTSEEFYDELTATIEGASHHDLFVPRIKANKSDIIQMYNVCIKGAAVLKDKTANATEVNNHIDSIKYYTAVAPYFYNSYLLARLYAKTGNTDSSKAWAARALTNNSSYDLRLFEQLRKEMNYVVAAGEKMVDSGKIAFPSAEIALGAVRIGEPRKELIKFRNIGNKPLTIKEVNGSCDCMKFNWDKQPVAPGKESAIELVYTGNTEGDFSKVIFIISDGINGVSRINLTGFSE